MKENGIDVKFLAKARLQCILTILLICEESPVCIYSFRILNQNVDPVKDTFLLDL